MSQRYWINTVSKDHVMRGVAGGFTQANHGAPQGLKRLSRGDGLVFYSPKTEFQGGEPLQAFTAIGTITDDQPYQVEMNHAFRPFRRTMAFDTRVHDTSIRPLLDELSFIKDKTQWGYIFRRGLFEIPEADFELIRRSMV